MERLKNGEFALRKICLLNTFFMCCKMRKFAEPRLFANISEATALTGETDALYQGEKNYPNLGK